MIIEKHLLTDLHPASYNPRMDLNPSDKEYQAIKNSIESFGNIEPIIWNKRTGNIVGGHQRYKILQEQGVTETEVVVVDFDDEKEKAANLALNKAVGLWDFGSLDDLLKELSNTTWDMTDFGFDDLPDFYDFDAFTPPKEREEKAYTSITFTFSRKDGEEVLNWISKHSKNEIIPFILEGVRNNA